jgi:hypothetical protein
MNNKIERGWRRGSCGIEKITAPGSNLVGRKYRGIGCALVCAGLLTSSALTTTIGAHASSLVYTKADGNVYIANPDGSGDYQVTLDGIPSNPYTSPSQAQDGTIFVQRSAGPASSSIADMYRLAQNGTVLSEFQAQDPTTKNAWAPSTQPSDPVISPDGRNFAWTFVAAGESAGEVHGFAAASPSDQFGISLIGGGYGVSWMGDSRLLIGVAATTSTGAPAEKTSARTQPAATRPRLPITARSR